MTEFITFGTDGWRAIIAEQFTFHNVERVAYAVGLYVKETYYKNGTTVPLLIGHDTRFLADKFARRAAQVLIGMGIQVKLVNRDVPTPCIAYDTKHEPTAGALQFTASHNPPEYCGIKYIPHFAGPATDDITNKLLEKLKEVPEVHDVPSVDVPLFDPKPPYVAALEKLIDLKKIGAAKIKCGYEALYSTSRDYLDRVLLDAGLTVSTLHNWRDPLFGGGMPEPKKEYLLELADLVVKEKLDIGLATDGDADRFAVIDDKGNYLRPNQLLCLLLRHFVKNRKEKGVIVRTVSTTHMLDRLAQLYGLEVRETPVGFKYIGEIMREVDVLIGGEESGGVSFKGHIPEKDGIAGNLMVIEMMAYEGKPLSQIWKDLVAEAGMDCELRRADLHLTRETQKAIMDKLLEAPMTTLAGEKVVRVGRKDGLKLYLDDFNWLLIRSSGTEPLLRLYAEGTSAKIADKIMADFHAQVEKTLKELTASVAPAKKSSPKMEAPAKA